MIQTIPEYMVVKELESYGYTKDEFKKMLRYYERKTYQQCL